MMNDEWWMLIVDARVTRARSGHVRGRGGCSADRRLPKPSSVGAATPAVRQPKSPPITAPAAVRIVLASVQSAAYLHSIGTSQHCLFLEATQVRLTRRARNLKINIFYWFREVYL